MMILEIPAHLSAYEIDPLVERWRPAPGLDGYEVSDRGRALSWWNSRGRRVGPSLVGQVGRGGYVGFRPRGARSCVWIHRLVCEAFHGPAPEGKSIVRHLDDDRTNNRADNLAWGDMVDNARDRGRNGRNGPRLGQRKLTEDQVREIRRRAQAGETQVALAEEFGVTNSNVRSIAIGRTWKGLV